MNLTQDQMNAVTSGVAVTVTLEQTECVVLRKDVYDRIANLIYDDSPPTDEERTRLAWESGKTIGWDTPEMAEYDDYDSYLKQRSRARKAELQNEESDRG